MGQEASYTCDTLLMCDPAGLASGTFRPAVVKGERLISRDWHLGKRGPSSVYDKKVVNVGKETL